MNRLSAEHFHEMQCRALTASRFIAAVASCGEKFFRNRHVVARVEVDNLGRVWFFDEHAEVRILINHRQQWAHFTGGGTMKEMVLGLAEFVRSGKPQPLNLGPWPKWICDSDLWGYGEDMAHVRDTARALGIWQERA